MTGSVWSHVAVSVISFLLGAVFKIGYIRLKGRKVYVPFIDRSGVAFTGMVVLMSALSLVTIFQVQQSTDEAEDCNRQFRAALTYNAEITTEQRELANRAQDISMARRVLLDDTFVKVGEKVTDAVAVRSVINDYTLQASDLSRQYDALVSERQSIDKNRKPYPEPSCGAA